MCVIKTKDKTIELGQRSLIMGILNVTPDSFSDGGKHNEVDKALLYAKQMLAEGADIIDIGGESTRPNHTPVGVDEEIARTLPAVKAVNQLGATISIDSSKAKVARVALENGAHIINDVWGFQADKEMAKVAAEHQVLSILMHNRLEKNSEIDIMDDCKKFFNKSIELALQAGLKEELIVLDVGIGFGKTDEQNIELLANLEQFKAMGFPLLLGTSRKSTIGKILDLEVGERVEGTIATTVLGIAKGVDIFRVHDVKENLRAAKVADAIVRGNVEWIK